MVENDDYGDCPAKWIERLSQSNDPVYFKRHYYCCDLIPGGGEVLLWRQLFKIFCGGTRF